MAVISSISIGDVVFSLSSELPVQIDSGDPRYSSFITSATQRPAGLIVPVSLRSGGMPDVRTCPAVFDSPEGWSMFQVAKERCVVSHPPTFDEPLWVCCFDPSPGEVKVYCGKDLIEEQGGQLSVRNPIVYPLDLVLLMYVLAGRGGLVLHSAGAVIDGRVVLLLGRSGAGKSTLSSHLSQLKDVRLLSDDRIVLREKGNAYAAYGTPWAGDAGIALNESYPVHAVCFLHQAGFSRIEPIEEARALEQLLPVVSIPWYDREVLSGPLDSCERLVRRLPVYDLSFTPDVTAAEMVRDHVLRG